MIFLKRRILALAMLAVLALTIGVQAAGTLKVSAKPRISFDDTTAICTAVCYGDHASDVIKSTLTLYQGSTYVDSWSASGTDSVSIYGESQARSGKNYTLKLTYSVNGVSKPSVSTSATCP